jgi:hypothetical protein
MLRDHRCHSAEQISGQDNSHQKPKADADGTRHHSDSTLVPQLLEIDAHADEKNENRQADLAQGVQEAE